MMQQIVIFIFGQSTRKNFFLKIFFKSPLCFKPMNKYLSVSNCCVSTWKGTKLIQFKNHKWSNKKITSIETWLFIKHLKFQSCLTLKPITNPSIQIFSGFEKTALGMGHMAAVYQQFGWIQKATNTNQHIVKQWWDSDFTSRFQNLFRLSC